MRPPVFLLIASYAPSVVRFRGDLIKELISFGWSVHVAVPRMQGCSSDLAGMQSLGVVINEIGIDRTGVSVRRDFGSFCSLLWLLIRVRPRIVLGYTIKPVIYGMIAAWISRVPYRVALITGAGYTFAGERRGAVFKLARLLYRIGINRAHKVFFQNPDDEQLFRRLNILSSDIPSVVVNGSGVDTLFYSARPLPAGGLRFLLIARLLGDKGIREYAEAARRIKSAHPEVCFGLAGWIDENPDAIEQRELDAWVGSGTIEFFGRLDDVRSVIADCSVYVLPSYREGTPRTVLEAMAMGRAIITTDAPGCRETVVDGDNGFLVPVRSVDDLVGAISKFIEDSRLAPRMGRRSREIAVERYDVRKVNDEMLREMGISRIYRGLG